MGAVAIDDAFAFGAWNTPFDNLAVQLAGVNFSEDGSLSFRVHVVEDLAQYRVDFEFISAFRVLDEHGLTELWSKTEELGGRPARTTFRVRNNQWSKESPISFLPSQGWSYIVATDWECIEIVSAEKPSVTAEV